MVIDFNTLIEYTAKELKISLWIYKFYSALIDLRWFYFN